MSKQAKDRPWVLGDETPSQPARHSGVRRKILAYCDSMMCVENEFEAGAKVSLHGHPHTQITYVSEGKFKFTIGEETRIVKKGDTMLKQNGALHGSECLEKGVLVEFFSPMREDFLK